jgi:hypothetical protein
VLYQLSYVSGRSRTSETNNSIVNIKDTSRGLERVAGIEPAPSAWKAEVLPLNYTRQAIRPVLQSTVYARTLVEGVGFEPTKA